MIKTSHFALALMVGFAFGAHAFAGPDPGKDQQQYTVSWDDFKYRCSDAKDKPQNEQGVPVHIRVVCTNVEREFVPSAPGTIALATSRDVTTSVLSDKYNVAAMGKRFPGAPGKGGGSCMRYKEVERTLQAEKILSCGEILDIKGDVNDFCAANLDIVKGTSPKLIETRDTGITIDTCGGGDKNGGHKFE